MKAKIKSWLIILVGLFQLVVSELLLFYNSSFSFDISYRLYGFPDSEKFLLKASLYLCVIIELYLIWLWEIIVALIVKNRHNLQAKWFIWTLPILIIMPAVQILFAITLILNAFYGQ